MGVAATLPGSPWADGTLTDTVSPSGAGTMTATHPSHDALPEEPAVVPVFSGSTSCSGFVPDYEQCVGSNGDICSMHVDVASVTQTPAQGWTFNGWSGSAAGSCGASSCSISMTTNRSITANYKDTGDPVVAAESAARPVPGSSRPSASRCATAGRTGADPT